jgi:hypothetical protein
MLVARDFSPDADSQMDMFAEESLPEWTWKSEWSCDPTIRYSPVPGGDALLPSIQYTIPATVQLFHINFSTEMVEDCSSSFTTNVILYLNFHRKEHFLKSELK